jgi:hypothetical protein
MNMHIIQIVIKIKLNVNPTSHMATCNVDSINSVKPFLKRFIDNGMIRM